MTFGAIDHQTPGSLHEDAEFNEFMERYQDRLLDVFGAGASGGADCQRRVLAWILEGKTMIAIATRTYVAAYVGSPDVVAGMTLHQIGALSGKGRSAAHNLAREFEQIFGVRSVHARSEIARKKYSDAYHRVNGTRPHSYNPKTS